MVFRCATALCALFLACSLSEAKPIERLNLSDLHSGDQIEVVTDRCTYRFEMVTPASGETVGRATLDGKNFAPAHRVYLLGATRGSQQGDGGILLIRMHEVRVGMRMELGVDSLHEENRRISQTVRSVRVVGAQERLAVMEAPPIQNPESLPSRQILAR